MSELSAVDHPSKINKTQRVNGVLYVAGTGPSDARIMFLAPAVLEEEIMEEVKSAYGPARKVKPRYLKGPAGNIFKDLALSVGVDLNECYYTAVCKWLLPRARRLKPSKSDMDAGMLSLSAEIKGINPDIIVCIGKPAFDALIDIKVPLKDIAGAWFRSEEFDCLVYPMDSTTKLVSKPEYLERFRVDIIEVNRMIRRRADIAIPGDVPEKYEVIETSDQLHNLISRLKVNNHRILSVDCEWHGTQHLDGHLRSIQIGWDPGEAAYVKFMDDKMNYVFDVDYLSAGSVMAEWLNDDKVKYIAHHAPADLPWMFHKLGLNWFGKVFMDTEFAQQTLDEHSELGLERLGMTYTTLGRYDKDLTLWCKKNSDKVKDGYGLIPDSILIPYALRDVDVVVRSYKHIIAGLVREDTYRYYINTFQPLTADVFTNFVINGLPVNKKRLDDLRELYHYCRDEMNEDFRKSIVEEARGAMLELCISLNPDRSPDAYVRIIKAIEKGDLNEAFDVFKITVGPSNLLEFQPIYEHLIQSDVFNIRSPDKMRRWLFQVKGYIPLKSTNNREKGLPSMDWSKVLELPEHRQREFTPSTDRQTLEILQSQNADPILTTLIELNAVGNICKAFLKKSTGSGDTAREAGLHSFIASDCRIHGQTSTTETGRPRSWKPNSLNWPKWVNDIIVGGMVKVLTDRRDKGSLPDEFEKYLKEVENRKTKKLEITAVVPSIRSCIQAPEGWCMVESDYQTAEIRALAYLSQDQALIDILTKPDPCFARVKKEKMIDDDCVCRLYYPDYLTTSNIPLDKVSMTYTVGGVVLAEFTDDDLLRDDHGNIVCSKNDLHWSLAEMVHGVPREMLNKERDRNAAKVGNFSTAYGATDNTLERKIESDTGIKPEPGTGRAIRDSLARRQPRATAFLESMDLVPAGEGFLRAASGRMRHFHTHRDYVPGLTGRMKQGMLAALGREARNFFCQESVAATAALSGYRLLRFGRENGLQGSPMTILYDSVVTLCPDHEREIWTKAHELYMFRSNSWKYGKHILNYPIDTEINDCWSTKPDKSRKEMLYDFTRSPVKEENSHLLKRLDDEIEKYKTRPELGIYKQG